MATMQIKVLYFAGMADRLGTSRHTVDLTAGASVADLLDCLEASHPAIGPYRSALAVAVNHVYSDPTTKLADGDEVALIPPVSGG